MKTRTYKTPHEITMLGFSALVEKLGPGAAIQFINQYETGKGNYTQERRKILKRVTLDSLKKDLLT